MLSKTYLLEDAVYCNSRETINLSSSGFNPNGGSYSTNINDQLAVSNNSAKLTNPVALKQ